MRYLSKLGNLLDEIDGPAAEKKDSTEPSSTVAEVPRADRSGVEQNAEGIAGLLSSAAAVAGSAATKAESGLGFFREIWQENDDIAEISSPEPTSTAEPVADNSATVENGLSDPEIPNGGTTGSLPADSVDGAVSDGVDEGVDVPGSPEPSALPSHLEVDAPTPPLVNDSGVTPLSSAPPSSRDIAAEGWSLEGQPSEADCSGNVASVTGATDGAAALQKSQLCDQLAAQVTAMSASAADWKATEKELRRQLEICQKEAEKVKKCAKLEASQETKATLKELRKEMEKELQTLLSQKDEQLRAKDEQLRALDGKFRTSERTRREQDDGLDKLRQEVRALRDDGSQQLDNQQKELEGAIVKHKTKVSELESKLEFEERQNHELSLSLRIVEERARAELAEFEAHRSQSDQLVATLQSQFQEEQQHRTELSITMGEAQQRIAELEGGGTSPTNQGLEAPARLAMEAEIRDLREELRTAEAKLLDAQSVREALVKEIEMCRSELKGVREERVRLEESLVTVQDTLREAQFARQPSDVNQEAALQAMQKDFDNRVERCKDEVQYLRSKCDEKERRCEQLLAERASLTGELRNSKVGSSWRTGADADSTGDIESVGVPSKALKQQIRAFPLATPAWVRSFDEPLRMVVKTLSAYPQVRMGFFAYVFLLHVWVLFILQQSAVQSSDSSGAALGTAE